MKRRGRPILEEGTGYQDVRIVPAEVPHDLPEDFFGTQGPVAADPPRKQSMTPAELNAYQEVV